MNLNNYNQDLYFHCKRMNDDVKLVILVLFVNYDFRQKSCTIIYFLASVVYRNYFDITT